MKHQRTAALTVSVLLLSLSISTALAQSRPYADEDYNLAMVYEKTDPREAIAQWERYIALASQLPSEKDWVDVARQHLRKLKNQVKE